MKIGILNLKQAKMPSMIISITKHIIDSTLNETKAREENPRPIAVPRKHDDKRPVVIPSNTNLLSEFQRS